jgi:hypothetical protein
MKGSFNKTTREIRQKLREILLVPALHWVKSMSIRYRRGEIPVLVFQVGKVGSSTVYYSLKAAGIACEHVHRIAPGGIARVADERRRKGLPIKDERVGLALNDRIRRSDGKVRIVTMVREPVSRNISAFFQNLADYYGETPLEAISVDDAIRRFMEEYPHHVILNWFDVEFEPVTGISIFDHPFPTGTQSMIVSEGRFEILVLRVEAPDDVKKEALERFLHLDNLELVRANVGGIKDYARLYENFRRHISLPAEYLDRMLDSKYARHFYTPEEITKIRALWLQAAADVSDAEDLAGESGNEPS